MAATDMSRARQTNAVKVLVLASVLTLAGGIAPMGAATEVEIQDNCAMCHDKAPVPADHVPIPDRKVTTCRACHAAIGSPALLLAVHGKHLDMGLPCATCHSGQVPERSALDAALEAGGPPDD